MAHDGEEEEHFQPVDEDENGEEDVEAGEGEIGESPQKGVSEEGDPQHFGGEKEAGFQFPVFGMEEGKIQETEVCATRVAAWPYKNDVLQKARACGHFFCRQDLAAAPDHPAFLALS